MTASPADAPVFLVGCPRSGTTLLQLMLDSHPEVAVAPETFFVRRFGRARRRYGDLADDAAFERLLDDVVAAPSFAEMQLDAGAYRAAARAGPRRLDALFRLLLDQFAARRGARVVGEKTPNHLLYLKTLTRWFPRARCVQIVRDPRAVVLSWKGVPWSKGSVAADAEVWRKYQAAAGRAPAGARIHVVHYEALLESPEPVLSGVCAFLDLPFDAGMLRHHETPTTLDVVREPWKSRALEPLQTVDADRWRTLLAPAEVRAIESVAWREMRRAGYRPLYGPNRLFPGILLAAARRRWRRVTGGAGGGRQRDAGGTA